MNKFIIKSKNKFNNFNYNNLLYKSTKHPVTLVCNIHNNQFRILTRSHLNSKFGGCKECEKINRFMGVQDIFGISESITPYECKRWIEYENENKLHLTSKVRLFNDNQ
jgi:hypothetical protein